MKKNLSPSSPQSSSRPLQSWGSRSGFLMAAIGAAVGLGNLWRFPYSVYSQGGGAFMIPYLLAILLTGVPLIILEFALGHKYKSTSPMAFAKIHPKFEWVGHFQSIIPLVIVTFYSVIIAWCINYFFYCFTLGWGPNPDQFFNREFLQTTKNALEMGQFRWSFIPSLLFIWGINYWSALKGVSDGIEKLCKFIMPLLTLLIIMLVIRGVTLPGSATGLKWMFTPDFEKIADPKVWISAYSQVFFSTTLAVGVMINYGSYLPSKTNLVGNGIITICANSMFDILAGLSIFSILGHASHETGMPIGELIQSGPGTAFVAIPMAIKLIPGGEIVQIIFGLAFFFCLIIAGISSSISMVECFVSGQIEKHQTSRSSMAKKTCLTCFGVSLLYVTGGGVHILDIVDHFLGNYSICFIGLIEVIVLGHFFDLKILRDHINENSTLKVGRAWEWSIRYFSPLLLGLLFLKNILDELRKPYSDQPLLALIIFGLGTILFVPLYSFYLGKKKVKVVV